MVAHVVALRVREDQIGSRLTNDVDNGALLVTICRVDLGVAEAERRILGAADLGRPPRFPAADARDLLRGVDEAATVAASRMAHHDLVALLHEAGQRPAAQDLEIVRMGADGENSHTASMRATSKRRSSTARSARRAAPSATASSARVERTTRGATGTRAAMRRSSGSSSFSPARETPPPTITVDGFRMVDRRGDATGQPLEQLIENAPRRLVPAVRRREDDLGVDRVRVAAGELEQRRALAACRGATAEAGESGPTCCVLERPEPVPFRVVVEDREVADLAGCATGSAVDVAADQDTAADADADLDVEGVVDPLRRATPALAQDGEMHLVVDEHRAGERRLQAAR